MIATSFGRLAFLIVGTIAVAWGVYPHLGGHGVALSVGVALWIAAAINL